MSSHRLFEFIPNHFREFVPNYLRAAGPDVLIYFFTELRSKIAFIRLHVFGSSVGISFRGGIFLRCSPLDKSLTIKLLSSLGDLRRRGVELRIAERCLIIEKGKHHKPLIVPNIYSFSKGELMNLIELIRLGNIYRSELVIASDPQTILPLRTITLDCKTHVLEVPGGARLHLGLVDPFTLFETFILRIHDQPLEDLKGKVVIDVGGHVGDTAIFFAKAGARVYSVEPLSSHVSAFFANLELNPDCREKITLVQGAIGYKGRVKIYFEASEINVDGSASGYRGVKPHFEEVESFSISDLLTKFGLAEVDYLKIDCKGCEAYLTESDLAPAKALKIEYLLSGSRGCTVDSLLAKVAKAGFEYIILNIDPYGAVTDTTGVIYARKKRH